MKNRSMNMDRAWILAHLLSPSSGGEADRICSKFMTMSTIYKDFDEALESCHQTLSQIDSSRPQEEIELELDFIRDRLKKICDTWETRKANASC